ncbi:MAG: PD40 domain-containing protein [Spirochaetes bacterium]|nr:PD40 domain-containing protein [Spirochaetota bacterium]
MPLRTAIACFSGAMIIIIGAALPSCSGEAESDSHAPFIFVSGGDGFVDPRPVTVTGYADHAMEPFITRDGTALFFNSLNDGVDTSLHWASRVSDDEFTYQGEIGGVNGTPDHLDAVASMDLTGNFYFTSTRSYLADGKTIYTGAYAAGAVTDLAVQEGDIYLGIPWLVMDAEVSPDGEYLYYSQAYFSVGPVPDASDILVARKDGALFNMVPGAASIMEKVNLPGDCLEYAPSTSADGLELFFTRFDPAVGYPRIYRTTRKSTADPFGTPGRIGAITGFAEAPSLSSDGKILYYHAKPGALHVIMMVTRP